MTGTDRNKMAFRGLVTSPNELAITGDGAMRQFTNGCLTRPALAQARRGIKYLTTDATRGINKFFNYDGGLLVHTGSGVATAATNGALQSLSGSTLTPLREYDAVANPATGYTPLNPISGKLRGCISGKNFYTAGTIVRRLSAIDGVPVAAGGLFAPGFDPSFTTLPAGSILANAKAVSYRYLFGYTDAKDYTHYGEVSSRMLVVNTSGVTASPKIRAIVPSTATTAHFIQFYRSAAVAIDATTGGYITDTDEKLCFEQQLTAANITDGYVELTDVQPEVLRGASIYTGSSQEGIEATNRAPPGCLEICSHKGRTLFANTIQPGEFFLNILSVGDTDGIQAGNVLSFSGLTSGFSLTAVRDFQVSLTRTSGTTVTGTTSEAHGYTTGDYVTISGGSADFGLGPFLLASGSGTTFTYAETGANVTLASQLVNKSTSAGPANGTYVARSVIGLATSSARIEATTQNLVAAINKHTSNTEIWAQDISDPNIPGQIYLRGRTAATTSFSVRAGAGSKRKAFSPQLLPANHSVSLTRSSNTVTATAAAVSFLVGDSVLIAVGGPGSSTSVFGVGPFRVLSVSATTFTYTETGDNGTLAGQTASLNAPTDTSLADEEIRPNRVYYSKWGEHEATTRDGWFDVGDADTGIKVVLSQRGQAWIWKTEGLFRVLGFDDSAVVPTDIRVEAIDEKILLLATESVVLFSNRCWGLTNRGVVAVSEAGIEVMSTAIADDLVRGKSWADLSSASVAARGAGVGGGSVSFETRAFATAYETERMYILHIPTVMDADGELNYDISGRYSGCTIAYAFNTESASWSLWDWGTDARTFGNPPYTRTHNHKTCALVSVVDDVLYLGDWVVNDPVFDVAVVTGVGGIYQERKELLVTDYRDSTARRCSADLSLTGTTVTGTLPGLQVHQFAIGDYILITPGNGNFPSGKYVVTGIPSSQIFTYTQTTSGTATLAGQVVIREIGIVKSWQWILQTMDAPHLEKRWDEVKFIFSQRQLAFPGSYSNSQKAFFVTFANETAGVEGVEVAAQDTQISRVWVPAEVARGTRLLVTMRHSVIDEAFDLAGLSIKAEVLDGASTR